MPLRRPSHPPLPARVGLCPFPRGFQSKTPPKNRFCHRHHDARLVPEGWIFSMARKLRTMCYDSGFPSLSPELVAEST